MNPRTWNPLSVAAVVLFVLSSIFFCSGPAAAKMKLHGKMVFYSTAEMESMVMDMGTRQVKGLGIKASHPALSPDGKVIAYIVDDTLRIRNLETGSEQDCAIPGNNYSSPTFISSETIAYLREDRSGVHICMTPVSQVDERLWAGKIFELTLNPAIAYVPGTDEEIPSFVLISNEWNNKGLFLISADSPKPLLYTTQDGDHFRYPAVSPDGGTILFVRDIPEGIWSISINGQNLRQIHKKGSWPTWSPDGKHIVFQGTVAVKRGRRIVDFYERKENSRTAGNFRQAIGIMQADGTKPEPLLDQGKKPLRTGGDNVAWQ